MSQTYIFHDQAGSIPGVPGLFSHCQVEIGDDGSVTVSSLPGGQNAIVVEATLEPVGTAEVTPEGIQPLATTFESTSEPANIEVVGVPAQEPIEQEQPVQEVVPEPEQSNEA